MLLFVLSIAVFYLLERAYLNPTPPVTEHSM